MSLFNSLGSNYEPSVAARALFGWHAAHDDTKLAAMLEERYGGKAVLVYKGREALQLALKALQLTDNSAVAISGFTCFAVYKAVASAGREARYLDIHPEQLNFTADALRAAVQADPRIEAVIIQNTLGYACDIQAIAQVCRERSIVLIEDLAHSAGGVYADGSEAGTVGDMVMLSFGRDKIIDAVAGGALIIRNPKYHTFKLERLPKAPVMPRIRDRLYPLLTAVIRFGYKIAIGNYFHAAFTAMGLLSRSVDGEFYKGHRLPQWNCGLTLKRYFGLQANLEHRQRIAQVYAQTLNRHIQFLELPSQTPKSTNLRFPIRVDGRQDLIRYLADRKIFIADTWYDAPIAPPRYLDQTSYRTGLCPASEHIAAQILNLPTHRGITETEARTMSGHINTWLKSK